MNHWLRFLPVLLLLLVPVVALAQTFPVREIVVEGTQRIERDTVLSYLTIKEGSTVTAAEINASIQALNNSGLFEDITFVPEGDRLVVRVVERPFVNNVIFEGNRAISDQILTQSIRTGSRTVLSTAVVTADAQRIVDAYGRTGRLNATVEPQIIRRDGNRIDVVFEIREGGIARVRKINFLHNESFSDTKLRDAINTKEAAWYRLFAASDRYDPGRVEADRSALERFYSSFGYEDFRVTAVDSALSEDGRGFAITYILDEGILYSVDAVSIISNVPGVDIVQMERLIRIKPGSIFDGVKVQRTADAILSRLELDDIPFANVIPKIDKDPEAGLATITFAITSATRRYIDRIDIRGNVRTLDTVIRRELTFSEGDPLNYARIAASRRNLLRLGYFGNLSIDVEELPSPDRVVVVVTILEKSTGALSFGIGYSSATQFGITLSLTERNLLGKGQRVRVEYSSDEYSDTYWLGFTEPYFRGRPIAVGFDLYRTTEDSPDTNQVTLDRIALTPRARFKLGPQSDVTLEYKIERSRTSAAAGASPLITGRGLTAAVSGTTNSDRVTRSSIKYQFDWDKRDDPLQPRSGTQFSMEQEFAGLGGDVKYATLEGTARFYRALDRDQKVIGNASLRFGGIKGLGGFVPDYGSRFFLGGTRFRGFELSGLGPRDLQTQEALGGNYYVVGSFDVISYSIFPEELGMTIGAFVDVGSLFGLERYSYASTTAVERKADGTVKLDANGATTRLPTVVVDQSAHMRATVGVEFQWNSPIGPMRFIFARPIASEAYDRKETFLFTVGTAF